MANIAILAPFILSFEGGYSDHPLDKGGPTNKGVTIATWRSVGYDKDGDGDIDIDDLRLLSDSDVVSRVLRPHYWDRWQADKIRSQSIANILVDWVWASGSHGITNVQRILGVKQDGIVGPKTLAALNAREPSRLFAQIRAARVSFLDNLVRRSPSQRVFLKGWMRRLDAIGYGSILHNGSSRPVQFIP